MSDPAVINLQAFAPYSGGQGARLAVTDATSSAIIPGLAGGTQTDRSRVIITNSGGSSAYVRMGQQGVVAATSSLEIPPGAIYTLTPPLSTPGALYIAAICNATETTTINVCAGEGT